MSNQRKKGAVLGYCNIVVKNIVQLLYTPMLLAFVGQAEYGVFQTANNFIISLQLLTFGFAGAYVRFYTLRTAEGDTEGVQRLNGLYLLLYLGVSAVALLCGLGFAANCSMVFQNGFTAQELELARGVMGILAVNIALTMLCTVFDAYIIAHERFTFQQSRQLFTSLATPGIALGFLYAGAGVVGVAFAQLCVTVALLVLNVRYSVGKLSMRFKFQGINLAMFGSIAAFSGWLFLNQIFDIITMNVPSVILGATCGASAVAVFAIAAALRSVFYSLSVTVSNLFVPLVNQIVASTDDNAELTRVMTKVGRFQAMVWWWALGAFVIVGRWFIGVWAGPEFLDAYWLTVLMVVAAAVPLCQNVGIEIQKAKNKHKVRSAVYLVCSVIDLLVTFLLAHHVGVWAGAIGYAVYIVLACWFFMNWYYHYRIGLDMAYFWKNVLPIVLVCLVATGACVVGASFVPVAGILEFLEWGVVYTLLCFGLLWVFALNSAEKSQVMGLVSKFKRG